MLEFFHKNVLKPGVNFQVEFLMSSTTSSTGPTAKWAKKQFDCDCLKVLLVHKRIFDVSFEDNEGENGSNKTFSDLYQEWVEPAVLEWYHVYVEDCLNTSQQISTLGSMKTVTV